MKVSRGRWLLAAAVLAGLSGLTRAGALDDRIPAESIGYVGWAGADTIAGQYDQSNLKGLLEASALKAFVNEQLPKLIARAGQRDPNAPQNIAKLQQALGIMWRHPTAFYFCPVDFSNVQRPEGRFGLICDAGDDAKAITDLANEVLAQPQAQNPNLPIRLVQDGKTVIMTFGRADSAEDLKKGGGLAGAPGYKAAMDKVKSTAPRALTVYFDTPKFVAMVNDGMTRTNAPADVRTRMATVFDSLGVNSAGPVAMTAGFDGKEWTTSTFVAITGPKKGALSLIDTPPLTNAALAIVPKDAAAFSAWKLDLLKAFNEARTMVGTVDPGMRRDFDAAIAEGNKALGINIEKELLACLGDEWTLYRAPLSDEGGNSFALVAHVKDGATLAKTLEKLETLYNSQPGVPVKVQKLTAAKTEVSSIAFLQYSVAWVVKNDTLYVSSISGIGGAIKQVENKSPSILESDLYKAVRASLPANVQPISISYSNPAKLYPEIRRMVLGVLPVVRANTGVDFPPELFPETDEVAKFMTPGGNIGWVDNDGVHGFSRDAFPGAAALGGQDVGPGAVGVMGVAAAVTLPRMAQGRNMSTTNVDAASLRGIAQSSLVYAADHKDDMPDDLARLVAENMVSPRQLVSRRSNTQPLVITPELEKLAKDDFAKFSEAVAEHCDFVYLGKGTKSAVDAGIIVAYEKPSLSTPDGINVAFQDGHSEFVPWASAQTAFAATNEFLKKNNRPAVDVNSLMRASGTGPGGLP